MRSGNHAGGAYRNPSSVTSLRLLFLNVPQVAFWLCQIEREQRTASAIPTETHVFVPFVRLGRPRTAPALLMREPPLQGFCFAPFSGKKKLAHPTKSAQHLLCCIRLVWSVCRGWRIQSHSSYPVISVPHMLPRCRICSAPLQKRVCSARCPLISEGGR